MTETLSPPVRSRGWGRGDQPGDSQLVRNDTAFDEGSDGLSARIANQVMRHPNLLNPTIVVITDRNDLRSPTTPGNQAYHEGGAGDEALPLASPNPAWTT